MKISLQIEMPRERQAPPPEIHKQTIEERVRECIEKCESGYSSRQEWILLSRLRTSLVELRRSASGNRLERIDNLMSMINPLLSKHGYHGVSPDGK